MKQLLIEGLIKEDWYDESCSLFIGEMSEPLAYFFDDNLFGKQITVRYWISQKQATRDELNDSFMRQLFGVVESEYEARYSEITGYLWTDSNLQIGGHDLLAEICSNMGKFLYMEVEVF